MKHIDQAARELLAPYEGELGEAFLKLHEAVVAAITRAVEDEREECALQVEGGPVMYDSSSGELRAVQTAREWFANALRRRPESFERARRFERDNKDNGHDS